MKIKLIIVIPLLLFLGGCNKETTESYVEKEIGINLSTCKIESKKDTHSGFHGDGDLIIAFDCTNNEEGILEQIKDWNPLPLSKNLDLIMYGGKKDGITYLYELATNNGIPKIKNGYYYFINRHSKAKTKTDDDIFNKYAFNFTLVLFDSDNNKMYFYECDT